MYIEEVYNRKRSTRRAANIPLLRFPALASCVIVSSTNCKTQAPNLKTVSAPQHRTPREAFPTHPLFSCSVDRPNANTPIILVDLIKTSAMKTLWEKHWLVGKRVPTHACRHGARSFKNRNFSPPIPRHDHPLFSITILWRALRVGVESSESGESQQLLVSWDSKRFG